MQLLSDLLYSLDFLLYSHFFPFCLVRYDLLSVEIIKATRGCVWNTFSTTHGKYNISITNRNKCYFEVINRAFSSFTAQ